jgi:hypothetical protein
MPISRHVVLLGDSILDNAAYVAGGPAVIDQVRSILPQGWLATLNALDGSVIDDVHGQLERLPNDASHLVLSVGGNDVLGEAYILGKRVETVGEGLRLLADIRDRFENEYYRLMKAIRARGVPTVICTIYNPCPSYDLLEREAVTALCLFNDSIVRHARMFAVPVLELREICSEVADFANAIEPSSIGGAKIARAIRRAILEHDFSGRQAVLFP